MKTDKQLTQRIRKLVADSDTKTIDRLYNEVKKSLYEEETRRITFHNVDNAVSWFKCFCKQHDLTIIDYSEGSKRTITIEGWDDYINNPYFMLWLNQDGHPHIEMGASYMDLWSTPLRMDYLEEAMVKIINMRKVKEAA